MFYEPIWEYAGYKLVKRPDTTNYHITWYRPGGGRLRRRSTGTSDLEEAKRRLIELAHDRRGPDHYEEGPPALLDLLSRYVARVTKNAYQRMPEHTALQTWTEFCEQFDVVYPDELSRGMQDRYIAWRRERIRRKGFQGSNGTFNRELRVMRAALNDAIAEGLIETAPRIKGLAEPPPRQRFLFADEVDRLLAACDSDHLYRFCMIALHTLQRPGAIFSLRAEQVDLRAGLIDFLPAYEVQTRKRRPVVPISKSLRPVLIEAIEDSNTGYLIERSGRPVRKVRKGFNAAREAAKLGPDVTPYTLRHTGATLLLGAGVPIRQVSAMLGHSEQRTTEMYGKHHVAFLNEAVTALDRVYDSSLRNPEPAPGQLIKELRANRAPTLEFEGIQLNGAR
jgi:integrase